MKAKLAFLLVALAATLALPLRAQSSPASAPALPQAEIAVGYSYLHSNAPPGGCGCFSMNGFTVQGGFPVERKGFSVVADFTVETKTNVDGTRTSLTLGSFSVGTRYRLIDRGWEPFGEVLLGGVRAHGGYNKIGITSPDSATLSFAGTIGGGLDRRLSQHWSLRLIEADYMPTTFDNGSNNHQNNLRVAAGLAFHFW